MFIIMKYNTNLYKFSVTVDSCTKSRLKLTLIDGADNGLIYIQGQGVACKDLTTSGQTTHEFNFASCGITWVCTWNVFFSGMTQISHCYNIT